MPVYVGLCLHTAQFDEGRVEVNVFDDIVQLQPGGYSRPRNDQRHVDVGVERSHLSRHQSVIAHVIAVVRTEHEVRVVLLSEAGHGLLQRADHLVHRQYRLRAFAERLVNVHLVHRSECGLARQPALTAMDEVHINEAFRKRAQSVLAVDEMIGAVQKAVASLGQENNTYFVFSSDNGYHMGDYRLIPGKMTAFDTDINVPLVVTGPGVPSGLELNNIVENIDLNPTFIELSGVE